MASSILQIFINHKVYQQKSFIISYQARLYLGLINFYSIISGELKDYYYNKMASIIDSFNLYPYMQLWRVAGKSEVNHKFGGILSIILVIIVVIVFILKLVEVFSMNTVTTTTQTEITIDSPLTSLSTYQNDSTMSPFMFALDFQQIKNSNNFDISDFSFKGYYIFQSYSPANGTIIQNSLKMDLQKCTTNHFSMLAGVQQNFMNWNINNWFCLPLQQSYEIGGNISGNYKYLNIEITCNSQKCINSTNNSIKINTYTLSTFINPYNNSESLTPYILKHQTVFKSQSQIKNVFNLDVNILKTDRSLFPFAKTQTKFGLTANQAINTYSFFSSTPSTSLLIYRSGRTITYERSYLKLFDAFAYVGGIFNAFLTIFFFMRWYGCVVHQLNFASEYFNMKQLREVGFFCFLYQSFYNLFLRMDCKPGWKEAEKYHQLKKTVNRLLDIIYLQRRLEFLQNAVSVLFQKHQITSLHLIHNLTREEADSNYEKFKFRNRLLLLLNENFTQTEQAQTQRQNQIQDLFPNQGTHKSLIIIPGSSEQLQSQRKMPSQEADKNEVIKKLRSQDAPIIQEDIIQEEKMKVRHFKTFPTLPEIQIAPKISLKSLQLQIKLKKTDKTFQERQLEHDNKQEAIGRVLQGLREVKQMLEQAERQDGDIKSKRISNKIDQQMKKFLKTVTRNANISKISGLIK